MGGSGWFLQAALNADSANASEPSMKARFDKWVIENGISLVEVVDVAPSPVPLKADSWLYKRYPFPDSGSFSRFYTYAEIYSAARILHSFFESNVDVCRFNLGPLKEELQLPIITVECNTPESISALKNFVQAHQKELKPDKPGSGYVNLPLDGSRKYWQAYWPQYDDLSAIKRVWDPTDFFFI